MAGLGDPKGLELGFQTEWGQLWRPSQTAFHRSGGVRAGPRRAPLRPLVAHAGPWSPPRTGPAPRTNRKDTAGSQGSAWDVVGGGPPSGRLLLGPVGLQALPWVRPVWPRHVGERDAQGDPRVRKVPPPRLPASRRHSPLQFSVFLADPAFPMVMLKRAFPLNLSVVQTFPWPFS